MPDTTTLTPERRAELRRTRLNRPFGLTQDEYDALLALADERDELAKRVAELEAEVETLRRYGNKDCTAMADAELTTKGDR